MVLTFGLEILSIVFLKKISKLFDGEIVMLTSFPIKWFINMVSLVSIVILFDGCCLLDVV